MEKQAINFGDIFKSGFLEKMTSVSLTDMIIGIALAFVIGLFIMQVYKKTFKGVMYSEGFCVSLMLLTLISTVIILAITSNVVLSLGMVGALSIIRFRSAIKEPMDIAFLFWAISAGIVIGAGLISLAVIGSIFIGVIAILFINKKTVDNPYILVINCDSDESEKNATELVSKEVKKYIVKSKTVSQASGIEMTIEIRVTDSTSFVNKLSEITGVSNVVLVSYNGDYMG